MSDEDREPTAEFDSSDIESETERLMEEAITKSTIDSTTDDEKDTTQTTVTQIDITFQRLQNRILDLLGSIDDSLKGIEPGIVDRVSGIMENVSKQLNSAGLGVFANRAINLVREEIEGGFAVEDILSPVYQSIEKSRCDVQDIVTKAGRGAVKNVGYSASGLQARLVQMYANMNELEKRLESSRAELHKWRGKVSELEERNRQREEQVGSSGGEIEKLRSELAALHQELNNRDGMISSLKGELGQTQSQLEQQMEMMIQLGSMEKISINLDSKMQELSELKGRVAQYLERMEQKDSEIRSLQDEIKSTRKQKGDIEDVLAASANEMASLRGAKKSYDTEISELTIHVKELKARWDALYSIAEDEPAFKAYFLIADKTQWFQLSHLTSALGIPTVLLKRQMQKFLDAGLIEIENDRIRSRSLSDLAREAEGKEAQMIKEAKAELGKSGVVNDKPLDPKEHVMPTPEYTGPTDGEYEQEGR